MLFPAGLLLQQGMTVGVLLFTELGGVEEVGRELFTFFLSACPQVFKCKRIVIVGLCVIAVVIVVCHVACVAYLPYELLECQVRIAVGGVESGVECKTAHEVVLIDRGVGEQLVHIVPCLVGLVLGE